MSDPIYQAPAPMLDEQMLEILGMNPDEAFELLLVATAPVPVAAPDGECANYEPPMTCLSAPSTVTGRCDWCRDLAAPDEEGQL